MRQARRSSREGGPSSSRPGSGALFLALPWLALLVACEPEFGSRASLTADCASPAAARGDTFPSLLAVTDSGVLEPITGDVRFAFVNDGGIVLGRRDGTFIETLVRGDQVRLSPDGESVLFVATAVAPYVLSATQRFRCYGTTWVNRGIYLWNLRDGSVSLVGGGQAPTITADGRFIAMERGDSLYVHDLSNESATFIGLGDDPEWISDEELTFSSEGRVYRRSLWSPDAQPVVPLRGDPLPLEDGAIQALVLDMLAGRVESSSFSLHLHLVRSDVGDRLGFLVADMGWSSSGVSIQITVTTVGRDGAVSDFRLPQGFSTDVAEFAVGLDGSTAALAVGVAPPGRHEVLYARARGSAAVLGGRVSTVESLGTFENVVQLQLIDANTLLVVTGPARIPVGEGAEYQLGAVQLEPVQLRMMGLDEELARVDRIHRVDLRTGERELFAEGHHLSVVR